MILAPTNFNIKFYMKPLLSSSNKNREKSKQTLNALHNRSHFNFANAVSIKKKEK